MLKGLDMGESQANTNISVVIITCERPEYLESALRSVMSQTIKPKEIIIIDDCSSKSYASTFDKFDMELFEYVRFSERQGANAARNKGVELASGEVIAFLDDDDMWAPTFLEMHLSEYAKGADAVVCGFSILGDSSDLRVNDQETISEDELKKGNAFCGMSGFSALSSVLKNTPFDINLKNGQDWDLFVRILMNGHVFKNIPAPLFIYRRGTTDGITSKAKTMLIAEAQSRLASAYKHREWMGEKNFRLRAANLLLSYIIHKRHKHQWIIESVKVAGFMPTIITLKNKLQKFS